jgi:hypothetical protein
LLRYRSLPLPRASRARSVAAKLFSIVPREPDYDMLADLRTLVSQFEAGEREMPDAFVFVAEDQSGLSVGIFGCADEVRAVGLLTMAAQRMGDEI